MVNTKLIDRHNEKEKKYKTVQQTALWSAFWLKNWKYIWFLLKAVVLLWNILFHIHIVKPVKSTTQKEKVKQNYYRKALILFIWPAATFLMLKGWVDLKESLLILHILKASYFFWHVWLEQGGIRHVIHGVRNNIIIKWWSKIY